MTITDITFDMSAPQYANWVEERNALVIQGESRSVTVTDCTFINLIGDGIGVGDSSADPEITACPSKVRLQGNRFFTAAGFKNRNGIGMTCGTSIQIKDNYFYGMARENMPRSRSISSRTIRTSLSVTSRSPGTR